MDCNVIIKQGRLIYASRPNDANFRRWRIEKIACSISYYKTTELTKLDKAILLTLEYNGNKLYENQLAKIMGFNVEDDYYTTPKRYADEGEKNIFEGLLEQVSSFGLITRHEKQVYLSPLGVLALRKGVKHSFFGGYMPLIQHFDIAQKTSNDFLYFPFRDVLGITSTIQNERQLPFELYNVENIEDLLYNTSSELVDRINLQSEAGINIFSAEESKDARMGEIQVDFRLYEFDSIKYPLVFYSDTPSVFTNELLFQDGNRNYIDSKIHIGEYLYLVRESGQILNYSTLKPYMDIWDLNDFLDSKYLDWSDEDLFERIAEKANGTQWTQISGLCPINNLKLYLDKYKNFLDWIILSERYDDNYIVENAVKYPWDFESLSSNRSISTIKRLLIIPELHKDVDWDWPVIIPKLDDIFIIDNISSIPFEMYIATERFLSIHPKIIADYPDRKWDWELISTTADLGFILNNIQSLGEYLLLDIIMNRAFVSLELAEKYTDSGEFAFAIIEKKEHLHDCYNANKAQFAWSINLIEWHEKMGFVSWESSHNAVGLECNNNINWDIDLFDHFKNRTFSEKGFAHISENIQSCKSIELNEDFRWIWPILSQRDIVLSDINFIKSYIDKFSLELLIPALSEQFADLLYDEAHFRELVSKNSLWSLLTEKVSESTIKRNFNESNWDWIILTRRFCASMHMSKLGDKRWVEKLDWDYLSEHLKISDIQEYLANYKDKWNWDIVTSRLEHDYIIDNLTDYYNYWNWNSLLTGLLTDADFRDVNIKNQIAIILSQLDNERSQSLWALFTKHYSTAEILDSVTSESLFSVAYNWNYFDVYNRNDFNIEAYLESIVNNHIYVDWNALSSSKSLNRILRWDRKVTKDFKNWIEVVERILGKEEYQWNFQYLSTLDSINWCNSVLQIRTNEWDWSYLSQNSSYFRFNPKKTQELTKHILEFAEYIDFSILSKRDDVKFEEEELERLSVYSWDWNAISSNYAFEFTQKFVEGHPDWDWDWQVLSRRRNCVFSCEFIKAHKEFDWDWNYLSIRKEISYTTDFIVSLVDQNWNWRELQKREDINFTEDLLSLIKDKDIDWKTFCQRKDFYPTMQVLHILKDKKLDWQAISRREELGHDVIIAYKDHLDWSILTRSSHIDLQNVKALKTFRDYLDWDYISRNYTFAVNKDNLLEFESQLNWHLICLRPDFVIDEDILDTFTEKLDWQVLSRNTTITFSPALVDKYRDKWDWIALSENPAFKSSEVESAFSKELNSMEFYNLLRDYRPKPCIYHFTHLYNAIEVIRTRKILSRNRAKELGLLKYDAAGAVVNRSEKAHPYARFYYRTGTQTQFYNECLGKDRTDTKYYSKAINNGLPMCPMPVFFKFDLQEVLSKKAKLCSYSTGNLQSNWATIYKVTESPDHIDAKNLYSNGYSQVEMLKRQQEFLVKNEFDFSDISNVQIICYDREESEILKEIFHDDPICNDIYAIYDNVEDVFDHRNPQLRFDTEGSAVNISTLYKGDYMFQIESDNITKIKVLNSKDIKNEKKNIIQLMNSVSVSLGDYGFDIYYVNMHPSARSPRWLIYQYTPEEKAALITSTDVIEDFFGISFEDDEFSPEELISALELVMPKLEELYNTRVRHYIVKNHTLLVCQQFEKYLFRFDSDYMNLDLMRVILAMHDVGKAIDRPTQHEHTLNIIRELWESSPFTDYELSLAECLLKNDHMGLYFKGQYELENIKNEISDDAMILNMEPSVLLQYKMILYQCDIASYTKDAGGLKYLEQMFVYEDGEKVFDEECGILLMAPVYKERYEQLRKQYE